METEFIRTEAVIETSDAPVSTLDTWIVRNAKVIRRLINHPYGNNLHVPSNVMTETRGQSHVHISEHGIRHQLTGEIFRTKEQIEMLLSPFSASSPAT